MTNQGLFNRSPQTFGVISLEGLTEEQADLSGARSAGIVVLLRDEFPFKVPINRLSFSLTPASVSSTSASSL
jgi:hypothetical protein